MEIKFSFEGARELEAALKELPKSVARTAVNAALRKASKPIVDAAKANLTKEKLIRTGDLQKSIKARVMSGKQTKYSASIAVGPDRKHFYGAILEKGTAGKIRIVKKTGREVDALEAKPWLRPAFDEHKQQAIDGIGVELWTQIKRKAELYAKRQTRKAGTAT